MLGSYGPLTQKEANAVCKFLLLWKGCSPGSHYFASASGLAFLACSPTTVWLLWAAWVYNVIHLSPTCLHLCPTHLHVAWCAWCASTAPTTWVPSFLPSFLPFSFCFSWSLFVFVEPYLFFWSLFPNLPGEGCLILSQLFSSSASSSSSSASFSSSSFSSSFSSTAFASTSMSTPALPTLRQLPHAVGTAGPQLPSALPTLRQLPHAVGTAGPQLPACDRSGHRWTSTWDLPSSVSTAGPQPGTFRAQWAPLDLNGQIECQKICQIECQKIC